MANGALITGTFEYEFRDTLLGGLSEFCSVASNLADLPDIVSSDWDLTRRQGEHPGRDYMAGRTIELAMELSPTTSTFAELVQQFKSVFAPAKGPATFYIRNTAIANDQVVYTNVQVRAISLPVDLEFSYGFTKLARVQMRAADPRFYELTANAQASIAEGATFDAVNAGNAEAPWILTINGPCTTPTVHNDTTGQSLSLTGDLTGGQTFDIDTRNRTVKLNDSLNRYSLIDPASEWFDLAEGSNVLELSTGDNNGTMDVEWRSAWV